MTRNLIIFLLVQLGVSLVVLWFTSVSGFPLEPVYNKPPYHSPGPVIYPMVLTMMYVPFFAFRIVLNCFIGWLWKKSFSCVPINLDVPGLESYPQQVVHRISEINVAQFLKLPKHIGFCKPSREVGGSKAHLPHVKIANAVE